LIRRLLPRQSTADPALAGRHAQAHQHPHNGSIMPASTTGCRYPLSVQLIRHGPERHKATRSKTLEGRGQGNGTQLRTAFVSDWPP
jgi:hypothetical protein